MLEYMSPDVYPEEIRIDIATTNVTELEDTITKPQLSEDNMKLIRELTAHYQKLREVLTTQVVINPNSKNLWRSIIEHFILTENIKPPKSMVANETSLSSPCHPLRGLISLVPKVGVEPTRVLSPADFESAASANSATSAVILLTKHIILDQRLLFKHILFA